MKTTVEFLDAVKVRRNLPSDYALAPVLGISRAAISKLRNRKDYFGDNTALEVAKVLEIEPAYVIACAHAERAKTPEIQAVWRSMAERICIMLNLASTHAGLFRAAFA